MTDKEIIKALECCFVQRNHSECPLKGFGSTVVDCRYELAHHVITLITARKSQIEDLKEALEERIERIKELESEVKELEAQVDSQYEQAKADILGNMADGGTSCHWCIDGHRSAAIRGFAERLKAYFITPAQTKIDTEIVELIETLVKEMTEDTDNGAE